MQLTDKIQLGPWAKGILNQADGDITVAECIAIATASISQTNTTSTAILAELKKLNAFCEAAESRATET